MAYYSVHKCKLVTQIWSMFYISRLSSGPTFSYFVLLFSAVPTFPYFFVGSGSLTWVLEPQLDKCTMICIVCMKNYEVKTLVRRLRIPTFEEKVPTYSYLFLLFSNFFPTFLSKRFLFFSYFLKDGHLTACIML